MHGTDGWREFNFYGLVHKSVILLAKKGRLHYVQNHSMKCKKLDKI
jgi:hypothetical protein